MFLLYMLLLFLYKLKAFPHIEINIQIIVFTVFDLFKIYLYNTFDLCRDERIAKKFSQYLILFYMTCSYLNTIKIDQYSNNSYIQVYLIEESLKVEVLFVTGLTQKTLFKRPRN